MGMLIGGVAIGCIAVLSPFFSALLWAGNFGVHHLAGAKDAHRLITPKRRGDGDDRLDHGRAGAAVGLAAPVVVTT